MIMKDHAGSCRISSQLYIFVQRGTPYPASSIRIITRNPASLSSQGLASKGVSIFKGDMSNPASLAPALKGIITLHLVTDSSRGAEAEIIEAKNVIETAQSQGVKHVVFSSVDGENAGVPHWEAKFPIEKMIKDTSMKWTILRPATFMDNIPIDATMTRAATLGMFNSAVKGKKIQLVAVEDIGWFAAEAMTSPREYDSKVLTLVGDFLSVEEISKAFQAVQGCQAWKAWIPQTMVYGILPANVAAMMKFMRDRNFSPDIDGLRKLHPGMLDFENWLRLKTAASEDM
ncbi:hypothetical protein DL96DRAFT_1713649 [Flagelloscypha sp. PMI_526]|nr:hypothetical protein DL96DRAFT_1713649 [Flagelloscypha sp. PMI_526]